MKLSLTEQTKIITGAKPQALGSIITGAYVSFAGTPRITILVHLNQANAATVTISLVQAKDKNGTDVKAISNNTFIWANENTAASEYLTRVATDAKSYTTSSALKTKMIVFQCDMNVLDIANGFGYIAAKTDASNAANIISIEYIASDLRYGASDKPDLLA